MRIGEIVAATVLMRVLRCGAVILAALAGYADGRRKSRAINRWCGATAMTENDCPLCWTGCPGGFHNLRCREERHRFPAINSLMGYSR